MWGCFNSMWSCRFKLSLQDNFWTGWLGGNLFNLGAHFPGRTQEWTMPYLSFCGVHSIANGPTNSEASNLHCRCKMTVFYSQCYWNKLNVIHTISWICSTLSEPTFLLGKVGSAGLSGSFPQKIPVRMSILFLSLTTWMKLWLNSYNLCVHMQIRIVVYSPVASLSSLAEIKCGVWRLPASPFHPVHVTQASYSLGCP